MSISAYPLAWPPGWPRAKARDSGAFRTTLTAALQNVQDSLRLFAADSGRQLTGLVISSNVTLGANNPADPGVAVWFTWDGLQVCIPVDRYSSVAANLQAIHHVLEARRVELRHGTLALVRASFTGFAALPAPGGRPWRQVLQVHDAQPTREQVERAYKRLAALHHPDRGGDVTRMAEINAARDAALREIA